MTDQPLGLTDVWCSSDGVNWSEVTSRSAWGLRAEFSSAVYQNRLWVIGGYTGDGQGGGASLNDVWYSPASHRFDENKLRLWILDGYGQVNVLE